MMLLDHSQEKIWSGEASHVILISSLRFQSRYIRPLLRIPYDNQTLYSMWLLKYWKLWSTFGSPPLSHLRHGSSDRLRQAQPKPIFHQSKRWENVDFRGYSNQIGALIPSSQAISLKIVSFRVSGSRTSSVGFNGFYALRVDMQVGERCANVGSSPCSYFSCSGDVPWLFPFI